MSDRQAIDMVVVVVIRVIVHDETCDSLPATFAASGPAINPSEYSDVPNDTLMTPVRPAYACRPDAARGQTCPVLSAAVVHVQMHLHFSELGFLFCPFYR